MWEEVSISCLRRVRAINARSVEKEGFHSRFQEGELEMFVRKVLG